MNLELVKLKLAHKQMLCRCYSTEHYKNYGGRGITVCTEWLTSRDAFITGAMSHGHAMNLSLDRKDNDLGYSPDNCRWATVTEQLNNQRRNRVLSFNSKTQTLSQWAVEITVSASTIWRCLERHLPMDKVLHSGALRS